MYWLLKFRESTTVEIAEKQQQQEVGNVWQLIAWWLHSHSLFVTTLISSWLIWQYIVVPELDRNQQSGEINRQVLQELQQQTNDQREIMADQQKIAEHLTTTAKILDVITQRMNVPAQP
jgi:p-aminobenzoyl-glutamate transporter AbgT